MKALANFKISIYKTLLRSLPSFEVDISGWNWFVERASALNVSSAAS